MDKGSCWDKCRAEISPRVYVLPPEVRCIVSSARHRLRRELLPLHMAILIPQVAPRRDRAPQMRTEVRVSRSVLLKPAIHTRVVVLRVRRAGKTAGSADNHIGRQYPVHWLDGNRLPAGEPHRLGPQGSILVRDIEHGERTRKRYDIAHHVEAGVWVHVKIPEVIPGPLLSEVLQVRKLRRRAGAVEGLLLAAAGQHSVPRAPGQVPRPGSAARRFADGQFVTVIRGIDGKRNAHLVQVVHALGLDRLLFCLGQGRQKQRRQNGDDGDHHEQFDQCEGTIGDAMGETAMSAWSRSGGIHRMAVLLYCLLATGREPQRRQAGELRQLSKPPFVWFVRISAFMSKSRSLGTHPYMRLLPGYSARYFRQAISVVGSIRPSGSWAA